MRQLNGVLYLRREVLRKGGLYTLGKNNEQLLPQLNLRISLLSHLKRPERRGKKDVDEIYYKQKSNPSFQLID